MSSMSRHTLPLFRLSRRNFTTTRPAQAGGGHGYYSYRSPLYIKRADFLKDRIGAKFAGGFFALWTLYHLTHNTGLVIGEFPYYNPEKDWSDEELGIPPDSEGLAPMIKDPKSICVPGIGTGFTKYYGPQWLKYVYGDEGDFKI